VTTRRYIFNKYLENDMNKITRALGICTLVLSLAGNCTNIPKTNTGIITRKVYEPEREYTVTEPTIDLTLPPFGGRFGIPIGMDFDSEEIVYVDDEDYILTFKGEYNWGGQKKESETRLYVSKEVYNSLNISDRIDIRDIPYELEDQNFPKKIMIKH